MAKSDKSEQLYVTVGRITAVLAMVFAVIIAQPIFQNMESAFQTVQELTGYIAPSVVAVFLLGMFYKPTNSAGAYTMLLASVILSPLIATVFPNFQFVNLIWVIFLGCVALGISVSKFTFAPREGQSVLLGDINFKTSTSFNVWLLVIGLILIMLYAAFW